MNKKIRFGGLGESRVTLDRAANLGRQVTGYLRSTHMVENTVHVAYTLERKEGKEGGGGRKEGRQAKE